MKTKDQTIQDLLSTLKDLCIQMDKDLHEVQNTLTGLKRKANNLEKRVLKEK